jgi:hypothetical protein
MAAIVLIGDRYMPSESLKISFESIFLNKKIDLMSGEAGIRRTTMRRNIDYAE